MKILRGQKGEAKAVKYLKKKGYTICERNFRSRFGEIDIIAEKDGVTAFVEVKTRTDNSYGTGLDAITHEKMRRLRKTAELYIVKQEQEIPCRFDVISIDKDEITHIENAF
ncbi:YraN family protein [Limisalsivibrio acetivorans]|uniref:YraN family protein n=1 Tax=Limisalsivibrio acetivorans TaxID=1304888 RepID=UPI0003B4DA35|nr:YraN family protein [Limisalsivibrio acetivorans]